MIEHNVEQGSPEWIQLRLGIPTASEFHRILTPGGELSKQADEYMVFLVAEKLLGRPLKALDNLEWVERGKVLEPEAAANYEFAENVKTRPVGFITTNDGLIGASPDRIIIDMNAGLEIKCPAPHTHLGYLLNGWGTKYKPQVMGQMHVSEFDYVARYSYHPDMPPLKTHTGRDEVYIRKLKYALAEFNDKLAQMLERARSLGHYKKAEFVDTREQEYADELNKPDPDEEGPF